MPVTESSLNKVLCSQVGQSASSCGIENFDKVPLFAEHGGKGLLVLEAVIAIVTNLEDDLFRLPCRLHGSRSQSNDRTDRIVDQAVQIFDCLISVPYPYPIPGQELLPATLGQLMLTGYYVREAQEICLDCHAHRPFSEPVQ